MGGIIEEQGFVCGPTPEVHYEEAPQVYKDIETVIEDTVSFGLIREIATFTPLPTYKVRER